MIKGRKRHILTDTEPNLVHAVIHAADIQDRDGGPLLLLAEVVYRFPWLRHLFADGDKLCDALRRIGKWTIDIFKRSAAAKGFEILPAALSSNEPWPASTKTAATRRILHKPSRPPPPACSPHPSNSSRDPSQGTAKKRLISNQARRQKLVSCFTQSSIVLSHLEVSEGPGRFHVHIPDCKITLD